jgi:transposase-like protein
VEILNTTPQGGRSMKKVVRIERRRKVKVMPTQILQAVPGASEVESLVEVIQALIPLGLAAVAEALQGEVHRLAGERYQRASRPPGRVRWGRQAGSVSLLDQKLPVIVPRVRDRQRGCEIPLETYARLQAPRQGDAGLLRRVLLGLSTHRYQECAEAVPVAFGLSPSTVSRRFIRASARRLQELAERRLDGLDCVAVFLDGKTFAEDELVIALGITGRGEKVILGFVQTATENEAVLTAFLQQLVARGLRWEQGLLCIIDGAKGLRAALRRVFGAAALVQRCQWHKRENILRYLPKAQQALWRRKLQAAYEQPTCAEAKAALEALQRELRRINLSAAESLAEGLEETLTLHRLGLFPQLGVSLKTTNSIESLLAQVGQRTDKVDRWVNSEQKQRWVATALLDIEPRLRRIRGYRYLPQLRAALLTHQQRRKHAQEVA